MKIQFRHLILFVIKFILSKDDAIRNIALIITVNSSYNE